jgi:16S rRNA (guanine527-N7)-methyltransferase
VSEDPLHARLAALAARWALPPAASQQLRTVLELIATEPSSITTVRDPLAGVKVHVADSLVGLELPPLREARTIADIGSGGGFPGLALAAALPQAHITLVESVGRKCAFLERAVGVAGLGNVEVVHRRAEVWPEGLEAHDIVTARALASLNVLVEYAAPLLRMGGALVAWKAARDLAEEADGHAAAAVLGLEPALPVAVSPYPKSGARYLHLYSKVRLTPPNYPRRDGVARKKPIYA